MAKKGKSRKHKKKKFTIPVLVAAPVLALGANAIFNGIIGQDPKNIPGKMNEIFGINKEALMCNYLPIGVGIVGHIAASRYGLNRALANSNIPLFRL